jgi:cell division protein ZapA (FtsZ GTPase activity inhibitor)
MQLIVMASIMVADELADVRGQLDHLQSGKPAAGRTSGGSTPDDVAAALIAAAERIEQVTKSLNRSLGNGVPMG